MLFKELNEHTLGIYGLEEDQALDEANFSLLPKFKADPKTKDIAKKLEKGITLIKSSGVTDSSLNINREAFEDANAAAVDAFNLASTGFVAVAAGVVNPLMGIITGVIWHLFDRITTYFVEKGNETYCIKLAEKEINYLENLADKAKGKDKQKLLDTKKKIEDALKEFKEKDKKKKENKDKEEKKK